MNIKKTNIKKTNIKNEIQEKQKNRGTKEKMKKQELSRKISQWENKNQEINHSNEKARIKKLPAFQYTEFLHKPQC